MECDRLTEPAPGLLEEGWLEAVGRSLAGISVPAAADGVVQFAVSGAPGGKFAAFHVIVSEGAIRLAAGRFSDPDALLKWKFPDFACVWASEQSLEAAYMTGQLTVEGDRVLLIDGWRPLRTSPEIQAALTALSSGSQ